MQRYPTAGWVSAIFALSLAPIIIGQEPGGLNARESRVPAGGVSLYARDIGQGPPAIVLHGGPDFDTAYLLPDLDRLADIYRLVYYDQRGRGKSADGVQPDDVSLATDLEDIERSRACGSDPTRCSEISRGMKSRSPRGRASECAKRQAVASDRTGAAAW